LTGYILRRVLINVVVVWMVATLVFFATSVLPGDFVAQRLAGQTVTSSDPTALQAQLKQTRHEFGLDKPVYTRYLSYIGSLLKGDLGKSYQTGRPAFTEFRDGLPYTVQLSLMTLAVGLLVAIPLGILAAIRQDSIVDYVVRFLSIFAVAAPNFWIGTILLFAVIRLGLWRIEIVRHPLLFSDPSASIKLFILPAVAGGLATGAGVLRILRSQMLEVLRQDYVRTAWAKGLRERSVVVRHVMKNAMIPVFTIIGLTIAALISGNVVFEELFNIPGVGYRILNGIVRRDVPVVQSFVLVLATFVVFVNLVVDMLYGLFDPRIRVS
jgi:peptide/nickel transport system permease protein